MAVDHVLREFGELAVVGKGVGPQSDQGFADAHSELDRDHPDCLVHDVSADAVRALANEGASGTTSIEDFIARPDVTAAHRVPGTAVFLNRGKATTPLAMRANVEHNHILHEHVVILSIETLPVPYVSTADRLRLDDLGYTDDGISHVTARFGYMQDPNVPSVLALADAAGLEGPLDLGEASYFLSTIELRVGDQPGMMRWRKRLFVATSRITTDAAEYFGLPRERTVIMGSRITV